MKTPLSQNRYSSLQAVRALAALAVVFHNTNFAQHELTGANNRLLLGASLGELGVDLFFVLSGFLMVRTTWGKAPGLKAAGDFLASRALRIYPVYWVMAVVWAAVLAFWPEAGLGRQSADLISSLLLVPADAMPQLTQAWSLVFEAFFYLVFGLIMLTPHRLAALGGWAAWLAICAVSGFRIPTAVGHLVSNPLALEFLIGCGVAVIARGRISRPLLLLAAGALLTPAGEFARLRLHVDNATAEAVRVLLVGLPAGLVVLGAVGLEKALRLTVPKWLEAMGDRSYALYLVNNPVACCIAAGFLGGLGGGFITDGVFAVCTVVLSLVAMELLHAFVEQPAMAFGKLVIRMTAPVLPRPIRTANAATGTPRNRGASRVLRRAA